LDLTLENIARIIVKTGGDLPDDFGRELQVIELPDNAVVCNLEVWPKSSRNISSLD
jgi:hypothetical protein